MVPAGRGVSQPREGTGKSAVDGEEAAGSVPPQATSETRVSLPPCLPPAVSTCPAAAVPTPLPTRHVVPFASLLHPGKLLEGPVQDCGTGSARGRGAVRGRGLRGGETWHCRRLFAMLRPRRVCAAAHVGRWCTPACLLP
ncbi:hypothetical protein E2C01_087862 [Portunus trituberculatus]|uniref:Uncharacterized protein n=1 Tax=Portunus trituberculatus TaxID=210409 RepID=A0A5B7JF73_PORTR|nr:hypothetical protein [Portunus trituberculatus]